MVSLSAVRFLRRVALLVLAAAALAVVVHPATAFAAYPDRPVKIVVPFAPGGTSDIVARILATALSQSLGQSVFVENRAGANGNIGISAVAKADADGYTLLVASSVIVVNPTLSKQATYDPAKDFAAIADLGSSPNVIVTRPDTGIKDVADLIARARANPDLFDFSSPGVGSISQLGAELLKLRANIQMMHVPFTGAGPATQAVLAGTTKLAAVNIGTVIPLLKAGKLQALVQTGKERWFDLPDVPTLAEAGVPNAASETFQALLAPAGTPKDIIDRLAKEATEIMQRPDIRDKLRNTGFNPVGSGPEALQARVAEEVAMWKEVIARTGLKVD
jgi:tripartite-type tricarboxylate transporter receptor subunit TctC